MINDTRSEPIWVDEGIIECTFISCNAIAPRPIDGKVVRPTAECTLPPLDLNQVINASFVDASVVLAFEAISYKRGFLLS